MKVAVAIVRFPVAVATGVLLTGVSLLEQTGQEGWLSSFVWSLLTVAASSVVVAVAEWRIGAFRVLALAGAGVAGATGVTALVVWPLAAVGEALASSSLYDSFWAPPAVGAAVAGGLSRGLSAPWRRLVPRGLIAGCAACFLFGGPIAAVITLLAAGNGTWLGAFLVPASPSNEWRSASATQAREGMAVTLGALALGLIVGNQPGAYGILMPIAEALDEFFVYGIALVLLLAAALVLKGRRLGFAAASTVLGLLAMLVAWQFTVEPLRDNWFNWHGQSLSGIEWQISVLLLWLAPALVLMAMLWRRDALLARKRAVANESTRGPLRALIASSDAGTLGHMATWEGNDVWLSSDGRNAVAYRASNGIALTVSDPIASGGDAAAAVGEFAEFCSTHGLTPVFYSVHEEHVSVFEVMGWRTMQVAEEAILPLANFSTAGKKRQDLRTALNRASREGIETVWTSYDQMKPELKKQVVALTKEWASHRQLPEMGFTLGGLEEMSDPLVRIALAVDEAGRVHGVTSWLPVYRAGRRIGYTLDVMRRGASPMPGVMEFLITTAAFAFQDEGLEVLSLSGSPLAGFGTPAGGSRRARLTNHLAGVLQRTLEPSYGFVSLHRFKNKFDPDRRPLLMAYPSAIELPTIGRALVRAYLPTLRSRQVLALLRATRNRDQPSTVGA